MATAGPNPPSAAAEDSAVGTEVWNAPFTDVFSSNNVRVTSGGLSAGEISHYLKVSGFGFTIPDGSVINGITADVERQADFAADSSVKIVKAGTVVGDEKSTGATWNAGTDTVATYGGVSDLWGQTWTVGDINDSGFGVAVAAVGIAGGPAAARIDFISLTVTYTEGQILLPDADTATGGWTTAPLFSKVNDSSDATIITATAA